MTPEERNFIYSLWHNHSQFMRNRIKRLGVREPDSEDVLMDCIINLIKVKETLQEMEPNEVRAYIAITVRNQCLKAHNNSNDITVPWDDDVTEAIKNVRSFEDGMISQIDTDHQTALLLNGLNDRDKLLLFGHFIQGLTDEELAKMLQCKTNSVRSLLCRAKKKARAILNQTEEGDSNGRA